MSKVVEITKGLHRVRAQITCNTMVTTFVQIYASNKGSPSLLQAPVGAEQHIWDIDIQEDTRETGPRS